MPKKNKKTKTREMLDSLDQSIFAMDYKLSNVLDNIRSTNYNTSQLADSLENRLKHMATEINELRDEISRLNLTIYEDRRVLADFTTKTVLNPDLAIDGGKKAKK